MLLEITLRTEESDGCIRYIVSKCTDTSHLSKNIADRPLDCTHTNYLGLMGEAIQTLECSRFNFGNEVQHIRGKRDGCTGVNHNGEIVVVIRVKVDGGLTDFRIMGQLALCWSIRVLPLTMSKVTPQRSLDVGLVIQVSQDLHCSYVGSCISFLLVSMVS